MKSGFYWGKYVDYPVWQVYYLLEDKAFPCSPNRRASWVPVRDLEDLTYIREPRKRRSDAGQSRDKDPGSQGRHDK